jgi:murein DD-endopeptidase MepM/ murein hydrolase activator NlpD
MMGQAPSGRGDEVARPGELRASDEDRDRVAEVLRVAAGDGLLTADELDQRLEQALTARTMGELAALSADLPAAAGAAAGAQAAGPKDLIRIDCQDANAKRDGRWLVPRRMEVRVAGGHVRLDFTGAVITRPVLAAISGHVRGAGPWGSCLGGDLVTAADLVSPDRRGAVKLNIRPREGLRLRHCRYPCHCDLPTWRCSEYSAGSP